MSVAENLAKAIVRLLTDDDRRCLLGEDVRGGGMLGLSKLAADNEDLKLRLLGAPLVNAAHVAHAGGLALAGLWPIVLLPSSAALLEALPALRELGRLPWRSAGHRSLPVLFVAPDGPGFGLGGDAAESNEATLAQVPGLELWTTGRTEDLESALRSAADFSQEAPGRPCSPRVLLLPRRLLVDEIEPELDPVDLTSRAATAILREGDQATLFAWGDALRAALAAADACAAANPPISVCVVELARLAPIEPSMDELIASAQATGKLIIAHSGPRTFGLGAELAAQFADRAILQLDAPIRRVCGESASATRGGVTESATRGGVTESATRGGEAELFAGYDEDRASPSAAAIVDAILDVVNF